MRDFLFYVRQLVLDDNAWPVFLIILAILVLAIVLAALCGVAFLAWRYAASILTVLALLCIAVGFVAPNGQLLGFGLMLWFVTGVWFGVTRARFARNSQRLLPTGAVISEYSRPMQPAE